MTRAALRANVFLERVYGVTAHLGPARVGGKGEVRLVLSRCDRPGQGAILPAILSHDTRRANAEAERMQRLPAQAE